MIAAASPVAALRDARTKDAGRFVRASSERAANLHIRFKRKALPMASLSNQKQTGTTITTTIEQQSSDQGPPYPSDTPLQGAETLDLYLSEIGRNMMAIGEQSALLLSALNAQVTLLREIDRAQVGAIVPIDDHQGLEQEREAGSISGDKSK
jgi:hypothetical protein